MVEFEDLVKGDRVRANTPRETGFYFPVSACCTGLVSSCIYIQKVFYPDQKRDRS